MNVQMARQFLRAIALSGMAIACAMASSTFANWATTTWSRGHLRLAVTPVRAIIELPPAPEQREPLPEKMGIGGSEPTIDLYGNEVSDAVAKYLLEPGGVMYEARSPQIKLGRLAAPKS